MCLKIGCYRHNKKQQEREDEDFPQGPKVSLDIEEKFKDDCDVPGKLDIFFTSINTYHIISFI